MCRTGRDECRLSAVCLDHEDPAAFYTSPWLQKQALGLFLAYRVVFAAAVLSILVWDIVTWPGRFPDRAGGWAVTVSHWAFTVLTAHGLWSAAVCFYHVYQARRVGHQDLTASPQTLHWSLKIGWVILNCSFAGAILTTILFSALLGPTYDWDLRNILIHVVNSVLVIIDILVPGFPCHLLHAVYPMGLFFLYVIFTVVFWAAGGTYGGNSYIYTFLDYSSNPGTAAGVAIGFILSLGVGQLIVYGLVKARQTVVGCVRGQSTGQDTSNDHTIPALIRIDQLASTRL